MLNIFNKEGGLRINQSDNKTLAALEEIRFKAKDDMRKYDGMAAEPGLTKEQRHFMANTRESYESTVVTGYALIVLAYLKHIAVDATNYHGSMDGLLRKGIENAAKNTELTRDSIKAISEDARKIVADGGIRLNGRSAVSLTDSDADFMDDGFGFVREDQYSKIVSAFGKYGNELAARANSSLVRSNLTPEQSLYMEFERRNLIISLKELFRNIKFLPFGWPITTESAMKILDDTVKIAVILEVNAAERLDVTLALVKSLTYCGILSVY